MRAGEDAEEATHAFSRHTSAEGECFLETDAGAPIVELLRSYVSWKRFASRGGGKVSTNEHFLLHTLLASASPRGRAGEEEAPAADSLNPIEDSLTLEAAGRLADYLTSGGSPPQPITATAALHRHIAWLHEVRADDESQRNSVGADDVERISPLVPRAARRPVPPARRAPRPRRGQEPPPPPADETEDDGAGGGVGVQLLPADLRELEYLRGVSLFQLRDVGSDAQPGLPFGASCRLLAMLGDGLSPSARSAQASPLRVAATLLKPQLIKFMGTTPEETSTAVLSAGFPEFFRACSLKRIYSDEPAQPSYALNEFLDGCRMQLGTRADAKRVEERRVQAAVRHVSKTYQPQLLEPLLSRGRADEQHNLVTDLSRAFLPERPDEPLELTLRELALKLAENATTVEALLQAQPPKRASTMVAELRAEQEALRQSRKFVSSEAERVTGDGGSARRLLTHDAIEKVLQGETFVALWDRVRDLNPQTQARTLWEIGMASQCTGFIQAMVLDDVNMLKWHEIFRIYKLIRHEFRIMISWAQTLLRDGSERVELPIRDWLWTEEAFSLFLRRKLNSINWVGHNTGFLGIRQLYENNPIRDVPKEQHYVVPACCEGIRDMMSASLMAVGVDVDIDADGVTCGEFWDEHIDHVKWFMAMGEAGNDSLNFASERCTEALDLASTLLLAIDGCPTPHLHAYGKFLPLDFPYRRAMRLRRTQLEPLRQLRFALPRSLGLGPGTPRLLEGVRGGHVEGEAPGRKSKPSAPSSVGQAATPRGGKAAKPSGPSKQSGTAQSPSQAINAPGSKAQLAKMLPNHKMELGGDLWDLCAAADMLGVDKDSWCWPRQLSMKKGDDRLALCPCFGKPGHEHAKSACHQDPPGFDLAKVRAKCATPISSKRQGPSGKPQQARKSPNRSSPNAAVRPGGKRVRRQ